MIVTTHQPIFLPWPGFFYKALRADTMVLLDEVQFPLGRGWMNRNRVKSDQGELWLTVPVWKKGKGKRRIGDVEICNETDWRRSHLRSFRQWYATAPYREAYLPGIESIYARGHRRLLDLNVDLIRTLWDALGIECRLTLQSQIGASGKGTDLLISVCRALGADAYVTLPIVEKYLDTEGFRANGISPVFARFRPPVYPQLWGEFRYNVSALDLLLNCGTKALDIIARSRPEDPDGEASPDPSAPVGPEPEKPRAGGAPWGEA